MKVLRAIMIYWIIGCLLLGAAMAVSKRDCPNDKAPSVPEMLTVIVAWPAAIGWALVGVPHVKCDAP
jgi:hypothetical protein